MKTLLLLFLLAATYPCRGQSSDNLVLQGRAFLVAKDMPNANARFAAAVAASPNHQAANALYAATRLLSLPYSAPGKELMDRLGVSLTNRNIYNWTAKLPKNKQGQVVPPNNFNAMEFTAFLRGHVLPEIQGALNNLTKASDRNFLLNLSSNETKVSEVTLDYGDIQVFRAFLHGLEFIINTVDSHNFDAQLTALYLMEEEGSLNLGNFLSTYTQALTFADAADLPVARLAFRSFADTYVIASDFIRKRPAKIVRLFNYDPTMDANEGKFRQTVTELRASLDGPVAVTYATNGTQHIQANLGRLLDGSTPIRSLLPEFRENGVVLGSLPDPGFHGVVSGFTPSEFYDFLGSRLGMDLLPSFSVPALPFFSLFVVDGRPYSIEASSDLVAWTEIAITAGTNGVLSFVDPDSTRQARRFYRAKDLSNYLSFEGSVLDVRSGKPLPGALISSSIDSQTAVTDSGGHFTLRTKVIGKTVGLYALTVQFDGFEVEQIAGLYNQGNRIKGLVLRAITIQPNGNPGDDMPLISGGSFSMGDSFKEAEPNELPVHSVFVSNFYMDKYEVTKALWDDVKGWGGENGYSFGNPGDGKATNHPVHSVNWHDVVKWCNARSQKEGRVPAYYTDTALTHVYKAGEVAPYVKWDAGYRLPTEAEWEKAARGGASGHRFPWSDSDTISHNRANYNSDAKYAYDVSPTRGNHPTYAIGDKPYTSPVGSFAANGYGLHDMAGNVGEWCWDWHASYSSGSQTDPRGPAMDTGPGRTIRGSGWDFFAIHCRASFRNSGSPAFRYSSLGFRSVLPPLQSGPADIAGLVASFRFDEESRNYVEAQKPLIAESIRFGTNRFGVPNRSLAVLESGFIGSLDHDYLKGRRQWTWSAWIRSDFPERAGQIVYSEDAQGNVANVQVNKGQVFVSTWNVDVPNNWSSVIASGTVVPGKWFHLAITFDSPSGNQGECRMFLDGQAQFVGTLPMVKSFGAAANTHAFALGQNIGSITGGQPSQGFAGAIDDVMIFERALAPSEIPGLLVPTR